MLPRPPWGRIALIAGFFLAVAFLMYRNGDMEAVHAYAARLHPAVAFALLLVLPLFGIPVSVLHVAAGIRFGAELGLVLVAVSIFLQLLASHALVRAWQSRFEAARWIRQVRDRIPRGEHGSIALVTVLLPGAPYAAINYVLPLLAVPLRTYLLVAFPIHTLRSTVTVLLGDQSDQLTPARLAFLLGYGSLLFGASWLTYRRIRSRLEGQLPVEGDRTQPA